MVRRPEDLARGTGWNSAAHEIEFGEEEGEGARSTGINGIGQWKSGERAMVKGQREEFEEGELGRRGCR